MEKCRTTQQREEARRRRSTGGTREFKQLLVEVRIHIQTLNSLVN